MKMSRHQLKALVKECLVEILTDGLGSQLASSDITVIESRRLSRVSNANNAPVRPNRPLDQKATPPGAPTAALREAIKRESHGNSVLADMLADTAVTTLPTFLSAQGPGQGGMPMPGQGIAEQLVAKATPEQIFGEDSTSRWADLAFMDVPTKKSA